MDVAELAVRSRGFDGFSYADLAQVVGIRKASIHYHFPTKADLTAALVERYHNALDQECHRIETQHKTGRDRLQAMIQLYRDALNDGTTLCLCVSLISSRESLSIGVIEKIKAFRAMMVARFAEVFRQCQQENSIRDVSDPVAEARAALALLEGAHLSARAENNVDAFDRALWILTSRLR
nr:MULTISPECIES: TetR/AcrR family transcriptional regulator [unclassified Ruegeria]